MFFSKKWNNPRRTFSIFKESSRENCACRNIYVSASGVLSKEQEKALGKYKRYGTGNLIAIWLLRNVLYNKE
jgi:hypothetical protein